MNEDDFEYLKILYKVLTNKTPDNFNNDEYVDLLLLSSRLNSSKNDNLKLYVYYLKEAILNGLSFEDSINYIQNKTANVKTYSDNSAKINYKSLILIILIIIMILILVLK